jgi:hypothetical protein
MMGAFDSLPTLATRPKPDLQKSAQPSRLQVKDAKDKDDAAKLKVWRDEVVRLSVKTLHPRRAECHHLAGRDDRAVRYDTRAGALTCLKCHERITGKVNDKLKVIPTMWFTKNGKKYPNADFPLTFDKVA